MIGGFLKLAGGRDLHECVVFTDWSKSSKAVSATVFVKTYTDHSFQVALFWGKLLSSTFDKKAPFLCELAGVVLFFRSNKYLIAGKMVNLNCDNIVCVGMLRRRLQLVDSFDDGVVHRLVNSKANAADFLSRFSPMHNATFGEILEQSNSLKDMEFLDSQSTDNSGENLWEYLKNSESTARLVESQQSNHWDKRQLREDYGSTHIFSDDHFDDVLAILNGEEIPSEVQEEMEVLPSTPPVPKNVAIWAETAEETGFSMPSDMPLKSLNCQFLFANKVDDGGDVFRSETNEDLVRFITKESHVNALSEEYMATLREDSHFIASQPSLCQSITNGMDGIIDGGAYESRLLLATYLQEVNVIFSLLGDKNLEVQENLFESWADLKEAAAKFRLFQGQGKRFRYFREVQRRSRAISLAKELVNGGKADEVEVDVLRRNDELFRILYNNFDALVIIDDLLFRAKFPMKGENHRFCLVLEYGDAERKMITLHSVEHRGHIYLYTLFCRDYYTPNALQLAYEVTSRCPNCAQMKAKKRVNCSRPNLSSELMNRWAIDMKGPILIGSSKHYVFCGVELNLRLVHFSVAKSLEATEIAKLIFDGIIASYGSSIEIISDRGKSFLNRLNQALFTLGSIHHRLTNAYHPQSSISEGMAVRKFSSAMKALICGRNLAEWSSNVKYLQVLLNSSLIHPHFSQTPFQMLLNSKSTFYHPVLEMPEETLSYNKFWEERVKKFQALTKCLRDRYDTYLNMKGNPRATVDSMRIQEGQNVWIRIFAFSDRLAYLSSLLPRFKVAQVVKILGKTSLVLEDQESGRKITRHLSDVYPIEPVGNFSNLFVNSRAAGEQDIAEDFGGLGTEHLTGVYPDGTAIDQLKRDERDVHVAKGDMDGKDTNVWVGRLRKRPEVGKYKE